MKLKTKTKKPIEVTIAPAVVNDFNEAMDEIDDVLVDRTEEVGALKMCLVTGSHLMLDGVHGTAKSLLAEEAFKRMTGAR